MVQRKSPCNRYKLENQKLSIDMKNILFDIEESDGFLIADTEDHAIVTQAKTWIMLMRNIDDAVRLHFNLKRNDKYFLKLDIHPDVVLHARKL